MSHTDGTDANASALTETRLERAEIILFLIHVTISLLIQTQSHHPRD
jgi:hypothetical protein